MELVRSSEKQYLDKMRFDSIEDQQRAASVSSTVYVSNVSLFTKEHQLLRLFSFCGAVKRIIMGLHRIDRTPCGFCFVEFFHRNAATIAEKSLSGIRFDDSLLKVDLDPGFLEGRQYGRARSGGQVRGNIKHIHRNNGRRYSPVRRNPSPRRNRNSSKKSRLTVESDSDSDVDRRRRRQRKRSSSRSS